MLEESCPYHQVVTPPGSNDPAMGALSNASVPPEHVCPQRPGGDESRDLASAVREAWRNHARCIGRLHWRSVIVHDRRMCFRAEEMIEQLWVHLKVTFNGGRIKPMVSVFPEKSELGRMRIWNEQVCSYAGYVSTGGEILGDPKNVTLTRRALEWGWSPPRQRSAFDLLPLVFTDENGVSDWRSLPSELVPEIEIVHPDIPSVAGLGLKWYPVPLVCNMALEGRSGYYPLCPFSGWYMVTEIGARNLGDTERYNCLPRIARCLALDTSQEDTMWRDRAMVELNVAVLHSFRSAGVRIVDHHSASREFEKFCENEAKCDREVSADWSWIVPPISGSATSVFHRSMKQTDRLPRFIKRMVID